MLHKHLFAVALLLLICTTLGKAQELSIGAAPVATSADAVSGATALAADAGVQPTASTILPTSGTTDPAVLASISAASAAAPAVEPAMILPVGLPATTAEATAQPTADDTLLAPPKSMVGVPRSFTRPQYIKILAALDRNKRQGGAVTIQATPPTQYAKILSDHNTYRATHSSPAMTWDNTVASTATTWAAGCVFQHQANSPYGENLYATSVKDVAGALSAAIKYWYDEVKFYDYNNPVFSSSTGHFTQVVWKSSTLLGCAAQICNVGLFNGAGITHPETGRDLLPATSCALVAPLPQFPHLPPQFRHLQLRQFCVRTTTWRRLVACTRATEHIGCACRPTPTWCCTTTPGTGLSGRATL